MVFLESWWDTLHDFFSLLLVVNLVSEQVARSAELQLGNVVLLALLDCDLFCGRKELLLSSHDLDELLQIFDFLWLYINMSDSVTAAVPVLSPPCQHRLQHSIAIYLPFVINL